jgi:hypothetical protein
MKLQAFNLVERVRREIALSAVGTTHHGDVLDEEHALPFPAGLSDFSDPSAFLSTDMARHFGSS